MSLNQNVLKLCYMFIWHEVTVLVYSHTCHQSSYMHRNTQFNLFCYGSLIKII
jgi:hypothetical protein